MAGDDDQLTDLLILGAGPVGLYAAYYAGLRKMSVRLVDSLDRPGGQLTALYPEKYIYDVAGFPRVLAKDLAANLFKQALHYRPLESYGYAVQRLDQDSATTHFTVHTAQAAWTAKTVLIAAGVGAFRPKKLALPNAAQWEGNGLAYAVRLPEDHSGKAVLVIGGGDSAVDWANVLAPIARSVTLIHRRDVFRAHEESVEQLLNGPVQVKTFRELKTLHGKDHLQAATLIDPRDGSEETIQVDAVIVSIGFESSLGPIRHWGLELEGAAITVDHMMQSNRPGIFAAGDIATYPGKLKLLSVGFGEAAIAVNHAKHFIDPTANIFPGHSTNLPRELGRGSLLTPRGENGTAATT